MNPYERLSATRMNPSLSVSHPPISPPPYLFTNNLLVIPPRETIPENTRRLTIDLRLRSGASLHLTWSPYASEKAKNNPALNDELLKAAREMPNPVENVEYGSSHCGGGEGGDGGDAKGKGKERPEKKPKGDIENKLRGFLGLGKGKK